MNILDSIIVVIFIVYILGGIKNGAIKEAVSVVSLILTFMISYYLKNPLASFFYKNLPFFNIKEGASIINILIYELIAFLIVFVVVYSAFKIIIKLTGILEKILNVTIVLGAVSKMLGAILAFVEAYIIVFMLLFILNQPFIQILGLEDSKIGNFILDKTPVLSPVIEKPKSAINELYNLDQKYKNSKDSPAYNKEAVDIFLKYGIIDEESLKVLKNKGKIKY